MKKTALKMENKKSHWNNIYRTKASEEVSWYQPKPETSLEFISELKLKKNARIIDVGGGDSHLVDHLLEIGYKDITVLDISEEAINRTKSRMGKKAEKIKWIVADAAEFSTSEAYDLWHDRAAFHFLTQEDQIQNYLKNLERSLVPGGFVVLGTFSEKGPSKCSGIDIRQYSLHELSELFTADFETLKCQNVDHITPTGTVQNFSFCSFKREEN